MHVASCVSVEHEAFINFFLFWRLEMNINREQLLADLKVAEGYREHAYQDTVGVWTIGYGKIKWGDGVEVKEGDTITRAGALKCLHEDMEDAIKDVERAFPWSHDLPEPAARALAEMCFNLGLPRLMGFKRMLNALKYEQWSSAHDEALDSRWAKQVHGRADRIAREFLLCAGR